MLINAPLIKHFNLIDASYKLRKHIYIYNITFGKRLCLDLEIEPQLGKWDDSVIFKTV